MNARQFEKIALKCSPDYCVHCSSPKPPSSEAVPAGAATLAAVQEVLAELAELAELALAGSVVLSVPQAVERLPCAAVG